MDAIGLGKQLFQGLQNSTCQDLAQLGVITYPGAFARGWSDSPMSPYTTKLTWLSGSGLGLALKDSMSEESRSLYSYHSPGSCMQCGMLMSSPMISWMNSAGCKQLQTDEAQRSVSETGFRLLALLTLQPLQLFLFPKELMQQNHMAVKARNMFLPISLCHNEVLIEEPGRM